MRFFMKKVMSIVIVIAICVMFYGNSVIVFATADTDIPTINVGDSVTTLDFDQLTASGYKVVDDRDSSIVYAWPYNIAPALQSNALAYGGTMTANLGQVSGTISYEFEGTFIAVAFAETYWAAKIIIKIDGTDVGTATPYNATGVGDEALASKINFIKDDLAPGSHTVTITHEVGHTSGDDNIKADGNAYYDNNAMFDCFITKKYIPETVAVGEKTINYTSELLTSMGYQVVDDKDARITYQFPYTLEGARLNNTSAYGGTVTANCGQVSGTFSYEFEGTFLAVAFAETYWAAKIIISIDGVVVGTATPYNAAGIGDESLKSKIIFVKDNLAPGTHNVTITHEAGHTSGDDNIKADGNAYYDNNAMFDCFITKKYVPETVAVGEKILNYTNELLTSMGYKVVDDKDASIVYTWPYDLESAKQSNTSAYGGTIAANLGQVSGTISYEFKGTYLAMAFTETYWAAKIIISIDGVVVGTATPYNATGIGDESLKSKIIFVKDNLAPGTHNVTITLEAAHTSGDDNIKPDGTAYYDNNAMFDCFIVQTNPTMNTENPIDTNPKTNDESNLLMSVMFLAVSFASFVVLSYKRAARV